MKRASLLILMIFALTGTLLLKVHEVRTAKQAVIDGDRSVIQSAIHAYTVDKGHSPQFLNDLVDAGYLKAIPQNEPSLPLQ